NRLPSAGSTLKPGESAYAELRLREPGLVLPGDRFILRQFSPVVTIGGGVVLDAAPKWKKPAAAERAAFLRILENGSERDVLAARVARHGGSGLSIAALLRETGWWPRKRVELLAAEIPSLVRAGEMLVGGESFASAQRDLLSALELFHKSNPLTPGMARGELMEKLGLDEAVFQSVVAALVNDKKVEASAEMVRL